MLEIEGRPILWHIMKEYSHYSFEEFIIWCGYKQHVVKERFADYYLYSSDVMFDFTEGNKMVLHDNVADPWKVTIVDTGLHTMTGGRVKRIQKYVGDETFMLTYGDGVTSLNIADTLQFYREHGRMVILKAVNVEQRFGVLDLARNKTVTSFREKGMDDTSRRNAGYMVLEPSIFGYIEGHGTIFEKKPLERAAAKGQQKAYICDGFWQCMDTKREMEQLNKMWNKESPKNPVDTYEVNVMCTVNVLECIQKTPSAYSFINVTTDKVYKNKEWDWEYRENEELNEYIPYSNSKSCSELITGNYNVGPDERDSLETGALAFPFCNAWNYFTGKTVEWLACGKTGVHGANFLKLNCSK